MKDGCSKQLLTVTQTMSVVSVEGEPEQVVDVLLDLKTQQKSMFMLKEEKSWFSLGTVFKISPSREAAGGLTIAQHDLFSSHVTARDIKIPSRGYPVFLLIPLSLN